MESLATPLVATVVCLGVGYLGLPFLAQQILNLGLKLMNMTEVWQQTVVVKDPRAIVQCVLKGDLGFGVRSKKLATVYFLRRKRLDS